MTPTREQLIANLRDALQHLYDYPHLRRHGVRALLPADSLDDSGRSVQVALTDALERFKPRLDVPPTAPGWRHYYILFYRYVQDMSVKEVALRLGISPRHLKREQNPATEALLEFLLQNLAPETTLPEPAPPLELGEAKGEIERMRSSSVLEAVPVSAVLEEIQAMLEAPFRQRRVRFQDSLPERIPVVAAYRQMFKQALIAAVGLLARDRTDGSINVTAPAQSPLEVTLLIAWRPDRTSGASAATGWEESAGRLGSITDLLSSFGGRLEVDRHRPGQLAIRLPLAREVPLLIVEDNPDTVRLYERYLAGTVYRAEVAGPETFRRAIARTRPAAAIIDIMMPGRDGWELLTELRQDPETADLPVLICSVLSDTGIAASLGASAYRQKPFSQQELLGILDRLVSAPSGL